MQRQSKKVILYIHGMGGGVDSRIPSILRGHITKYEVVIRTYCFDPEVATEQIRAWVDELDPALIIGESLGACHAIKIKHRPHILVSPSLGAPFYLGNFAVFALIPGVTWLLDKVYKPKEGDRQKLHFTFTIMRKYRKHREQALACSPKNRGSDYFYAFFGSKDHYRKSGIVSVRLWRKYFGDNYEIYDGTHFMEEEYLHSKLIPKIYEILPE